MTRTLCCRYCRSALEPAQALAYLVELETEDPVMLAEIRRLPHSGGKPIRVCRKCQPAVTRRMGREDRAVFAAVAAVGMVALTATIIGRWLTETA